MKHPKSIIYGAKTDGSEVLRTHQLRLVVDPTIYQFFFIPGGAGVLPSTVSSFQHIFYEKNYHPASFWGRWNETHDFYSSYLF